MTRDNEHPLDDRAADQPRLDFAAGGLVLNFALMYLAPGDIADTIAGDMGGANAEVMAEIRRSYGLDRPVWEQLASYLWNVVHLDLGYSLFL